jgi:hypothetical protein
VDSAVRQLVPESSDAEQQVHRPDGDEDDDQYGHHDLQPM